jgi:hypothetical protein
MALETIISTLQSLIPTAAADVVAVFTPDFKQVFSQARPIKGTVKPTSELMKHPIETGANVIDHSIFLPTEIELSLVPKVENYQDTYQTIKQIYQNRTLLTVQTLTDVYENMLILEMPHEESPDMRGTVAIALKLQEVILVTPQFSTVPRNKNNTNTVNRGQQQSKETAPTEKQSSALKKIFS